MKKVLNNDKLNKLKLYVLNYSKTNKLFLLYILFSIITVTLLRICTIAKWYNFRPFIMDLAFILILGSISYLLKIKKKHIYFLVCYIIYFIICFVNSIYYTFYSSFASFGLLATLGQVGEIGVVVLEGLNILHFIYFIPFILFIYYIKKYKNKEDEINTNKKNFFIIFIVSISIIIINLLFIDDSAVVKLNKQRNRYYIVENFGIILYQSNDLLRTLENKVNTIFGFDEAFKKFNNYYDNNKVKDYKNEYTNIFKGKNLVFVHMESMMSFFVDLKINNVEITPNLNKLTKEGIYFSKFYPEISVGTSSDSEFTLNTSLLPVQNGTVFVSYYNRYYESIEKLLKNKGYYTFSMHGNKDTMWNRNKMHPSLGYIDMYFEDKYNLDNIVGLGLSDESFFNQIIPILKEIENKEPYMGTIITLSNHTPFDDLENYFDLDLTYTKHYKDVYGNYIEEVYDYLENTKLGNYIKSANYADYALGKFIDLLYENDIMNNTVFVFYGDHDAKLSRSEFKNYYNFDFETGEIKDESDPTYVDYDYYANELNKNTPLIIWTKDKQIKKEVDYYMGMIDVLPTIGNMFGFKSKYALGNDIFEIKNNNIIPFPNGNFLTNKVYYNSGNEEYKVLSNEPIDESYIENCKNYTENIIELSDNIIVYDLIKYDKEKDVQSK